MGALAPLARRTIGIDTVRCRPRTGRKYALKLAGEVFGRLQRVVKKGLVDKKRIALPLAVIGACHPLHEELSHFTDSSM